MKQFKWKISFGMLLSSKEKTGKKKNLKWLLVTWVGMVWTDRIASKDCISVDFRISDAEIESLLLRVISAPSEWDILHCKIKYLANTHAETLVLYSVHSICQVFQCTKM